jgi:hypothetical protein
MPSGHDHIPPVERGFTNSIRFNFLHIMGIVANYSIATFSRDCASNRRRNAIT